MVVGSFEYPGDRVRPAQGAKSKAFHFTAPICAFCNGARTQAADREFDLFHTAARAHMLRGNDPLLAFEDSRYREGSKAHLNLFRYFAKLLCCHMAEVRGPRPIHMSRFAVGDTDTNCVYLQIGNDWTYRQAKEELGPHPYAAHGGLVVYAAEETGSPRAFHSSITVGELQYVFWSRLTIFEQLALRFWHRPFWEWCRECGKAASDDPVSRERRMKLGLPPD